MTTPRRDLTAQGQESYSRWRDGLRADPDYQSIYEEEATKSERQERQPNPATKMAANHVQHSTIPEWPGPITMRGPAALLARPKLALFCSVKCPGALIIQTYDLARTLRDAGTTIISGFHTPMERECLTLLLRGAQPIIICPAREIATMRLPAEWKSAFAAGRLLLLSPFAATHRRVTKDLALQRNAFVATLADTLVVTHATPGGNTERLCRDALAHAKPVLTFDHPANTHLLSLGATPIDPNQLPTP